MSRPQLYLLSALICIFSELLLLALASAYLYAEVTSRSVFRVPYSVFFFGLLQRYRWVIVTTVPLISWASTKVYLRVKNTA